MEQLKLWDDERDELETLLNSLIKIRNKDGELIPYTPSAFQKEMDKMLNDPRNININ